MRAPRLADIRRGDRYLAVNTTILASLALFASAFTADDAAGAISPSGFYIAEVTTDGPGCPAPGSVQVTLSADRTRIQILYDDMQLQREPGVAVQTTHCTAALSLHIPPGWRVAPANLRTRGHTILDQGMTARRATDLAFVGIAGGPGFTSDFKGPLNNVYQVEDLVTPGVGQTLQQAPTGCSSVAPVVAYPTNTPVTCTVNAGFGPRTITAIFEQP